VQVVERPHDTALCGSVLEYFCIVLFSVKSLGTVYSIGASVIIRNIPEVTGGLFV
jgi:hypothetical protein